jgi:hypothetical protein
MTSRPFDGSAIDPQDHAARSAGARDQEIVAAFGTSSAGESVGQESALQAAAKLPLDVGRDGGYPPALRPTGTGWSRGVPGLPDDRTGRIPGTAGNGETSLGRFDSHVVCQAGEWENVSPPLLPAHRGTNPFAGAPRFA